MKKKPSSAKIRAEKTQIETLDEYRNTIKFLEAKCLRLEDEISKFSQHDAIKTVCRCHLSTTVMMCTVPGCTGRIV